MKVSQLITALKKMPKDLDVWVGDHDHSKYEANGPVRTVEVIDKSEFKDGDCDVLESTPDVYVLLHL